jgi:hypothetical protein
VKETRDTIFTSGYITGSKPLDGTNACGNWILMPCFMPVFQAQAEKKPNLKQRITDAITY